MKNKIWVPALLLCLAAVVVSVCPGRDAVADTDASSMSPEAAEAYVLLTSGLEHYQHARYEQAAEALEKIIELRPDDRIMIELHNRMTPGALAEIITDVVFREDDAPRQKAADAATVLLRFMSEAQRRKMPLIDNIDQVMSNFQTGSHHEFLEARRTLISHDRFATPFLVELLAETGAENKVSVARAMTTLRDIGRSASRPLTVALQTDDPVLKSRIVSTLDLAGDTGALPALLVIADDESADDAMREAARTAIGNIQNRVRHPLELQSAIDGYRELAMLYFMEDASRVGHVLGGYTELWNWDAGAEQVRDRLVMEFVPSYVYFQASGTRTALAGLRTSPSDIPLQGLLLATMSRELAYLQAAGEGGTENQAGDAAARRSALMESALTRTAHLYGADAAGAALHNLLEVRDSAAAVKLIRVLAYTDSRASRHASEALGAALEDAEPEVLFQAALAILRSSPEAEISDPNVVIQTIKNVLRQEGGGAVRTRRLMELTGLIVDKAPVLRYYPVAELESLLLSALDRYDGNELMLEQVIGCLNVFGTGRATVDLSRIAAETRVAREIRTLACAAIGAIARREPGHPYEDAVFHALQTALQDDGATLQREAALALNVLLLHPEGMLEVAGEEIMKTKVLGPADLLDLPAGDGVDDADNGNDWDF